jgi:hypothetical protein
MKPLRGGQCGIIERITLPGRNLQQFKIFLFDKAGPEPGILRSCRKAETKYSNRNKGYPPGAGQATKHFLFFDF